MRSRLVLAIAFLVCVSACSWKVTPSPTVLSSPPTIQPATPTFAVPTNTPTATQTVQPSPTQPKPSATATNTRLQRDVCGSDLALHPPVTADGRGSSETDLQAAVMIPSARSDLEQLGLLPHYTISATLDMNVPMIYGSQLLVLTNAERTPLNELYFGLYPNAPFNAARLDIGHVTVNGEPATISLEESDTALRVALASPFTYGTAITVHMNFTTTVPRDVPDGYAPIIFTNDMLAMASWYPILLVHDEKGWHSDLGPEYGDLVFSASALYTLRLTSPDDVVVVSSGIPFDTVRNGDGTKTQTLRAGPVRDFYLTASRGFCATARQVGETIVNSYYLAGDEARGRRAADVAAAMVAILNEKVGVYPYREFDVVQSPIRAGGVEYPGVVAISTRYYRTDSAGREMDFVVAHEAAHQWWYSVVGNDQVNEPWLDEALTNYSAALYWESEYGVQAAQTFIRQQFQIPYEAVVRAGHDKPVNLPVAAYGTDFVYAAIVYDKGALFYVNLRQAVGDATFFRILQEYYRTYKYGISRDTDFLDLASRIGGPVVGQVYETWIIGTRP